MKSVRIYISVALYFICCIAAYSHDWLKDIDYRLEVGATVSTITNLDALKSKYHYSGKIGASVSVPLLCSPVNVSSGLFITQKGVGLNFEGGNKLKAKPTYIEIPLCLSYRFNINEEQDLFVDAGGYGAIGVVGKLDFVGDDFSNLSSKDIFRLLEKPINRFDAGLTASVLYEYMSFAVRLGGSFGLMNAVNNKQNIDYWHSIVNKNSYNMQLFLSVGYRFFFY